MEDYKEELGSVFHILITICIGFAFYLIFKHHKKHHGVISKIPGPKPLPILGNAHQFLGSPSEAFRKVVKICQDKEGMTLLWIGGQPYVGLYKASAVEVVLSSNKHLDKSSDYEGLHTWLGTGLLTSTGTKWHRRRKMLTPTFHFKILEDFVEIFNQQSQKLLTKLQSKSNAKPFHLYPYITLCTLDIIMESAMGTKINAQDNSSSEYVKSIFLMCMLFMEKQARPWMKIGLIATLFGRSAIEKEALGILHGFSNGTIKERRKRREEIRRSGQNQTTADEDLLGKKKRLAFLDMLLEYSETEEALSDEDIREEVDTFMFEGHDTTAASIHWTLYLLGRHPEIQEKVYEEIESVFGKSDRPVTPSDLRQLKYLECCIKESLRLFPSVPAFGRELKQDIQINGFLLPKDTRIMIFAYILHRDPEIFPNPEAFIPERFLPENCFNRNPYAYVPFSAGPRNCIGQKFALMEEKVVLSTFLRKYRVESLQKMEDLPIFGGVILRTESEILVQIYPRK